jgi:hypothetical protein
MKSDQEIDKSALCSKVGAKRQKTKDVASGQPLYQNYLNHVTAEALIGGD